jgi:hypothetical protein
MNPRVVSSGLGGVTATPRVSATAGEPEAHKGGHDRFAQVRQ